MSFTDDSVQSDDDFSDEMNDLCLPSSQTSSAISVLSPYNPITSVSLPVSSSSSRTASKTIFKI